MTDEKKPGKEGTKAVETERGPVLGSLISTARIMGSLVGCAMRFVFAIDPDRPIWRPEVIELSASIRRWFRSRKQRQGGEATAPREKWLTLDEIEKLPQEEWETLPEDQKQRYFDWMTRENSPSPWEFYGYEAEREQPLEWPEDAEESSDDADTDAFEGQATQETAAPSNASSTADARECMELIGRRGDFSLSRFETADGATGYLLEEAGTRLSSEDGDEYEFHERVGMISGAWELFVALDRGRPWAQRIPVPAKKSNLDDVEDEPSE
jgi:hypothetical protein